jgi:hypothetical protein
MKWVCLERIVDKSATNAEVGTMNNMTVLGPGTNTCRALVLASSLALLLGLGPWVNAVEAWEDTSPSCGSTFPATGQTQSYPAFTLNGNIAVQDDGAVRAGGALSYTGTGPTIIDNNTGLEWEVLGQPDVTNVAGDGSIHDYRTTYWWSCPNVLGVSACAAYMSIWDKVLLMNNEGGGGYAGHSDWRVPNVKELMSIIDYSAFGPAVDSVFNNGSHTGVCNPNSTGCSFTDSTTGIGNTREPRYWSSTTISPASNVANGSDNLAWYVSFGGGAVPAFNSDKDQNTYHVRLVRGGCSNGTPLGID